MLAEDGPVDGVIIAVARNPSPKDEPALQVSAEAPAQHTLTFYWPRGRKFPAALGNQLSDDPSGRSKLKGRDAMLVVAEFLEELWVTVKDSAPAASQPAWVRCGEVLLDKLAALLDDKAALEVALARALGDLEVARAQIKALEGLRDALFQELYRKKEHRSSKVVGVLAFASGMLLQPFSAKVASNAGDHLLPPPTAAEAAEAADEAAIQCGIAINFYPSSGDYRSRRELDG